MSNNQLFLNVPSILILNYYWHREKHYLLQSVKSLNAFKEKVESAAIMDICTATMDIIPRQKCDFVFALYSYLV